MYKYTVEIRIEDDIVHRYSIMEWETVLLRTSAIHQSDLPLSFGRIAEVLAEEYHRYGNQYFQHEYGATDFNGVKETTDTIYTDKNGLSLSTRVLPVKPGVLAGNYDLGEGASTMQVGIGR